ncbi:MAG: ABC transporter substrate-binding protein [Rhodobacter sp.]|nr:ABC transporter substrate-binding protein [Rhodobacter sp.]
MVSRTRRVLLGGLTGVAAALALPLPAFALTNSSAEALIDKVVADINRIINSGKSEAAMIRDFKGIFDRYGDNSYIAAYAMGVDGRRASRAQKRAFSDAFGAYISRKYGKRFREFIGGKIDVRGVQKVKTWFEVDTVVRLRGQAPFRVVFYVSDRTGKDLFFNMFIEGVNLLLSERQEIGAMLDRRRGNIDAMIADLRKAG